MNVASKDVLSGRKIVARFLATSFLALLMIVADQEIEMADQVRHKLSLLVVPMTYVAQLPSQIFDATRGFVRSKDELLAETRKLEDTLVKVRGQIEQNDALLKENARLKDLLGMRYVANQEAQVAEVINTASIPFVDRILLDKGALDGVKPGQGVFDANGVVGQITRVDSSTSIATLLTDSRIWVATRVQRTGVLAVVHGVGDGTSLLGIQHMPADAELAPGDLLVTAGDGGVFPPGLPVGEVISVDRSSGGGLLEAQARSKARIAQYRSLLIFAGGRIELPSAKRNRIDEDDEGARPAVYGREGVREEL